MNFGGTLMQWGRPSRPLTSPLPVTRLRCRPTGRLEADRFESAESPAKSLAVLFHSSNGFRHDLTQLAWSLALQGVDSMTVTWLTGSPRRAYPDAYEAVRELLQNLCCSDEPGRPVLLVTWCDSSLVVLTELNRLASHDGIDTPVAAVSVAGVFGWSEHVPESIAVDSAAIAFFGGRDEEAHPWRSKTPFATLGSASGIPLVSVTNAGLLHETRAYHRAARAAGHSTRLIQWDGPEPELLAPRLPAGRAIRELIVESALRLTPTPAAPEHGGGRAIQRR